MPILDYAEGATLKRTCMNGLLAVETQQVTKIERAVLPGHSLFILQSNSVSTETWQGERLPERKWSIGDVAFLPERSELQSISARPLNETILTLSNATLIETARAYIERSEVDCRFADITTPDTSAIAGVLRRLLLSGEAKHWPLLTDSLQQALIVSVVRWLEPGRAAKADAKSGCLDGRRERRVTDFIEENISNAIRLGDLAGAAAMSQFHFSRSFKRTMGVNPSRYVLERRIREAKMLLRMTRRAVSEIALACGFASQSHFTTAFKSEVGVSPGEYRRVRDK